MRPAPAVSAHSPLAERAGLAHSITNLYSVLIKPVVYSHLMDVRAYLIKALFAHVPRLCALIDGDDYDGAGGGSGDGSSAHSALVFSA